MLLIHKILVILWESPHNILQPEPTMPNSKTFDETSWSWHTICLWLQSLRPLEVICQLYVSLRLPHFRKVTITFQSQKENTIIYASRLKRTKRQLYNGYVSKNETFLMTHTADKCDLWRAQPSKWDIATLSNIFLSSHWSDKLSCPKLTNLLSQKLSSQIYQPNRAVHLLRNNVRWILI